MDTMRQFLCHH